LEQGDGGKGIIERKWWNVSWSRKNIAIRVLIFGRLGIGRFVKCVRCVDEPNPKLRRDLHHGNPTLFAPITLDVAPLPEQRYATADQRSSHRANYSRPDTFHFSTPFGRQDLG